MASRSFLLFVCFLVVVFAFTVAHLPPAKPGFATWKERTLAVGGKLLHLIVYTIEWFRQPVWNGELVVDGLHGPIRIHRDPFGVPHVVAGDWHDVLFGQGFVHAQDRLWQMHMNMFLARGRLSEVFGEVALPMDKILRTLGFDAHAKHEYRCLKEAELDDPTCFVGGEFALTEVDRKHILVVLDAYVAGINAYLNSAEVCQTPIEFFLVGLRLGEHRFTAVDVLANARFTAWQMTKGSQRDIVRSLLVEAIGEVGADDIEPSYETHLPYHLPKGIVKGKLKVGNELLLKTIQRAEYILPDSADGGSNAWVLSGNRTTTGQPILANDPHLPLTAPSLWHQSHLTFISHRIPDQPHRVHMSGFSMPLLPGILAGQNDFCAWGVTLANIDVEDVFLEEFTSPDNSTYLYQGESLPVQERVELIRVKGRPKPIKYVVRSTHHGPLVAHVFGTNVPISIRSTPLSFGPEIGLPIMASALRFIRRLAEARNWHDFRESMRIATRPSLNIVFADFHNIGYHVTGRVPIRKSGLGDSMVPGWTGEYEWEGYVPFEKMPHALNPECGYVISSNNPILGEGDLWLGNAFTNGHRAHRIQELIESTEKISVEDCARFQGDLLSGAARDFQALVSRLNLEETLTLSAAAGAALADFTSWSCEMLAESVSASVYSVWRTKVIHALFRSRLDPQLTSIAMGQGLVPVLKNKNQFSTWDSSTLFRMVEGHLENGTYAEWFATGYGDSPSALFAGALEEAVAYLADFFGSGDQSTWHWGQIHQVSMKHQLAKKKPLDQVFNVGPFPVGGDEDTIALSCGNTRDILDGNYNAVGWGVSHRRVVDMSNKMNNSYVVLPPGNAANIASVHFKMDLEDWQKGRLRPMCHVVNDGQCATIAELILSPPSTDL